VAESYPAAVTAAGQAGYFYTGHISGKKSALARRREALPRLLDNPFFGRHAGCCQDVKHPITFSTLHPIFAYIHVASCVLEFSTDILFKEMQMRLRNLLVTASMLFTLTAVHAEEAKPGPAMNHGEMREEMKQHCDANPEKCAEMKERMKKEHEEIKAACAKEPARCKEIRREHREQRREKMCAENPERCAKMKAHREEMQKQCAADPKACEARKAEVREKMKERMEQRNEQGMGPHDGMPMSPMHDGATPDKK
jgi:hypothetical protein